MTAVAKRSAEVIAFIETFCRIPEGRQVGQPLVLMPFQRAFIEDIYDNPAGTRSAYLTVARKNGKTALLAAIALVHIVGPMALRNSQVVSGARSRDQAALLWSLAAKMIDLDETLRNFCHVIPSQKKIIGLPMNVEYKALSADGSKNMGLSPILAILDEVGQVVGPTDYFTDSITSAQGAHDNPMMIAISTQAPSDADMFSLWIDDALRNMDPHIICHIYCADKEAALDDVSQLAKANPAIGKFLNEEYLTQEMTRAARMPSEEAKARNLHLNQRISLVNMWLAPKIWNENCGFCDMDILREHGVHLGLDLSKKNDLTAAVFAANDPDTGQIHMHPVCFTPLGGIEDRSRRDRVPYDQWVRDGMVVGVPGDTLSYDWVAEYLKNFCDDIGIDVLSVQFDRWRIAEMRASAERKGFALDAEWAEVGQGFVSMSPRIENFDTMLLERRLRHGGHPVLNMGAASAIRVQDASGNSKLDKSKSSQKIDALVAALMAVYPFASTAEEAFDVESLIG